MQPETTETLITTQARHRFGSEAGELCVARLDGTDISWTRCVGACHTCDAFESLLHLRGWTLIEARSARNLERTSVHPTPG